MRAIIANSPILQKVTVQNRFILSDTLTGTHEYYAIQSITSTQLIESGSTDYRAGEEIILLLGFLSTEGAEFSAMIEEVAGCDFKAYSQHYPTSLYSDEEDNGHNSPMNVCDKHNHFHFHLLPNPNPGTFQIETNFPLTDIVNLKVINLLGTTIYETQHLASHEIQLQNSGNGLFFVVVTLSDGTVLTQKMMVQR